ncbi:hypothetical protein [Allosphingosinicella deserti]|nr:hypothetical protein [Sphingomonas deserti]
MNEFGDILAPERLPTRHRRAVVGNIASLAVGEAGMLDGTIQPTGHEGAL